jgi:ribosomal protein S20
MEQLDQECAGLREENENLGKDNKHQESMVHELQKKFEEAAKEADEKAEKECQALKKIAMETQHTEKHVEISFSYNMSL